MKGNHGQKIMHAATMQHFCVNTVLHTASADNLPLPLRLSSLVALLPALLFLLTFSSRLLR